MDDAVEDGIEMELEISRWLAIKRYKEDKQVAGIFYSTEMWQHVMLLD